MEIHYVVVVDNVEADLLSSHGSGLGSHSLLVISSVLTETCVRLRLGGVLDVGVVEEVLDAEEDLLDGDGGPPVLLLVQDAETHCARWVDIGVEQWWHELHLGWCGGEVILEDDLTLVESTFPWSTFLTRDSIPEQIKIC